MLNDIDDALLPQHIVTPDGRKFQVRRNDMLDGDKPQRMKMEGDKNAAALNENPVNTGKRTSFEWIVEGANVTHRRFIKKGTITGTPNQRVK